MVCLLCPCERSLLRRSVAQICKVAPVHPTCQLPPRLLGWLTSGQVGDGRMFHALALTSPHPYTHHMLHALALTSPQPPTHMLQLFFSQLPDLDSAWWASAVGAAMSVGYSLLALGMCISKGKYILKGVAVHAVDTATWQAFTGPMAGRRQAVLGGAPNAEQIWLDSLAAPHPLPALQPATCTAR